MKTTALVLLALIAALHLYIAWFEIFAWTSRGPAVFDMLPQDLFAQTTQLAANQGVYNAFLAVGLIWAVLIRDEDWQFRIATCFLLFVAVAGMAAAVTLDIRSGLPQLLPAGVALVLFLLVRRRDRSS